MLKWDFHPHPEPWRCEIHFPWHKCVKLSSVLKGSWDFMTYLGQIRTDWSFCFGLGEAYTCSSTPLYIYIKTISNSLKIPGNATSNRVSSPFFSTLPLCVDTTNRSHLFTSSGSILRYLTRHQQVPAHVNLHGGASWLLGSIVSEWKYNARFLSVGRTLARGTPLAIVANRYLAILFGLINQVNRRKQWTNWPQLPILVERK